MDDAKALEILEFEEKATLPPRDTDFWEAIRVAIKHLKAIVRSQQEGDNGG